MASFVTFALKNIEIAIFISSFLSGFFIWSSAIPMLEYSIILSLPLSPSYSNTFQNIAYFFVLIVTGEFYSFTITKNYGKEICLYSAVGLILLSCLLAFCMNDDRSEEKEH